MKATLFNTSMIVENDDKFTRSDGGDRDDSIEYGLPISLTIACIGTITNSMSISFFLRRKNRNIGDRFLVFLNSLDITLCLYSLSAMVLILLSIREIKENGSNNGSDNGSDVQFMYFNFFAMLVELSGLATCFLCALRCIAINWPLYQTSRSKVYISAAIVAVCIVTGKFVMFTPKLKEKGIKDDADGVISFTEKASFVNVSVMILFVIGCSVISIRALKKIRPEGAAKGSDGNKKATKMVLILSLLFVTFNLTWVIILTVRIILEYQERKDIIKEGDKDEGMLQMMTYIIMSINSASNPIVYMTRNEEMIKYVKQSLSKVRNVICKPCSSWRVQARVEPEVTPTWTVTSSHTVVQDEFE